MENASKALIMAGGVFIGILILGIIVFSYKQLTSIANDDHKRELIEQQKNYNAQWEKYNDNIYGTDMISLANQIVDYNKTQAENQGYSPISATITITKEVKSTETLEKANEVKKVISKVHLKQGDYTADEMYTFLQTIEKAIEDIKKVKIENKTIPSLASMRLSKLKSEYGEARAKDIQNETYAYQEIVDLYKEMKSKKFKATIVYDDVTGRVSTIKVEEK